MYQWYQYTLFVICCHRCPPSDVRGIHALSMVAQVNAQAVRDFWQLVDSLSIVNVDSKIQGGGVGRDVCWIMVDRLCQLSQASPRSSLSTEVRMEVLRFTDSTIVQSVHDYMIKLLRADAWPENYNDKIWQDMTRYDKQSWFLADPCSAQV